MCVWLQIQPHTHRIMVAAHLYVADYKEVTYKYVTETSAATHTHLYVTDSICVWLQIQPHTHRIMVAAYLHVADYK